jgi:hypothetical protein
VSAEHTAQAEPNGASLSPAVSEKGRFVAYDSTASDLVTSDTNNRVDVFVRDRHPQPKMVISPQTGATGSYFKVTGNDFAPNSAVSFSINGRENLGTAVTDGQGNFVKDLDTSVADNGFYIVTATTIGTAASQPFMLDPTAGVAMANQPQDAIVVPSGIAFDDFIFLPFVANQ